MIEVFGDFWDFDADFYCITTNGIVKKNGEAIMGAGIAKQARDKFPGIAFDIGRCLKVIGNYVIIVPQVNWNWENKSIVTFPTKYDWRFKSSLSLIERSSEELKTIAEIYQDKKFVLAFPGIGNGGLIKQEVRDIIEPILPNNVYVINWEK